MRGIAGREKRYVEVVVDVSTDGTHTPLTIVWEGGRSYEVEEVIDVCHARSRKVGGGEVRYTVRVAGNVTYLFREGERWFVEAKTKSTA